MKPFQMLFPLAVALVCTSCALLPGRSDADDLDEPVSREITLEVDNQNFHDATLYGLYAGERRRLGSVVGLKQAQFAFAWGAPDITVEIYLLAVGSYFTQSLPVQPGEELKLVVQPNLHMFRPGTVF